jgi:hypothetical protein
VVKRRDIATRSHAVVTVVAALLFAACNPAALASSPTAPTSKPEAATTLPAVQRGGMDLAKVYFSATQSVGHNTNTAMLMDTVESDSGGYWSPDAPTRLTVPVGKGGVPFIVAGGSFTTLSPAQDCIVFIRVNGNSGVRGSTRSYPQTGTNDNPIGYIATKSVPVVLEDGDFIELVVYFDSPGETGNFGHSGSSPTWLSLVRLAP